MRVRIFTLCLLFLLFSGESWAAVDQPDYIAPKSKVDFNFSSASSFKADGRFEVPGDTDVYRVSVPSDSYIEIETSGEVDPYLRLYTQDEKLLAFDANNGKDNNSHLVYQVKAGTYFIMLDNRSNIQAFYTLNVKKRNLNELSDDVSNNPIPSSAIVLDVQSSPAVSISKVINYYGDADYFSFDLKSEGNIQFSIDASSFPIKFTLYDKDYRLIREADASSLSKYIHDLAAGKYIIAIQAEEQVSANYTLDITHLGVIVDEDSDSISGFTGREINHLRIPEHNTQKKRLESSMDYIGDVDIIKITVDQPGELIVIAKQSKTRIQNNLDIKARLYDYQGRQLEADISGFSFRIDRDVAAGTYYLATFTNSQKLGKYKILSVLIYERDQM